MDRLTNAHDNRIKQKELHLMLERLHTYVFGSDVLPYSVKSLVGAFVGRIPDRLKYGSFFSEYSRRMSHFMALRDLTDVEREHEKLLVAQVNRAIDTIPYYSSYGRIRTSSDLRGLPVLNKRLIIDHYPELVNPLARNKAMKANTGGSRGTPMEFLLEKGVSRPKEKAHFGWFWGQFGYKTNARVLMVRGAPLQGNRLFEYRTFDNVLNVSCYSVSKNNIHDALVRINKYQPVFIHAYPSSLKVIASLLDEINARIEAPLKCIFLGSEHLSPGDREYFEDFFRTKVVTWYGHSEKLIHGGNCPCSKEFHFYPAYGHMELLDDDDSIITTPGIEGRIVATGFDNTVMPLIRYDTGDTAVLAESTSCRCGFTGHSLSEIVGREQDYIVLSDQTRVSLTAFIPSRHLESFRRIREMQVVQNRIGEIELRLITSSDFTSDDENTMGRVLQESVSNKLSVHITYVDRIAKTPRGKNIFLVSRVGLAAPASSSEIHAKESILPQGGDTRG